MTLCAATCEQGHRRNGDKAARRPHILCSVCVHSFRALAKAVGLQLFKALIQSKKMSYQAGCIDFSSIYNDVAPLSHGDFSTPDLEDITGRGGGE